MIEAPKARLKEVQRWLLHEVLDRIPPHDAAHGFAPGRSVVSHAALHAGHAVVLRWDLRDFFASIAAGRVYGIFLEAGYRPGVAHTLTGLCTNTVPLAVWEECARGVEPWPAGRRFALGRALATPHLPQGAPTSPSLANLAAFGLDRWLTGLAASLGMRYSRYADDLTFSGPPRAGGRALDELISRIAGDEGFALNPDKSVALGAGVRQTVCGVVVNVHPNMARAEYERLKAILHNAALHGPSSQNRDGVADLARHLRGRIAWLTQLNPARGAKLLARFEAIDWGPVSER